MYVLNHSHSFTGLPKALRTGHIAGPPRTLCTPWRSPKDRTNMRRAIPRMLSESPVSRFGLKGAYTISWYAACTQAPQCRIKVPESPRLVSHSGSAPMQCSPQGYRSNNRVTWRASGSGGCVPVGPPIDERTARGWRSARSIGRLRALPRGPHPTVRPGGPGAWLAGAGGRAPLRRALGSGRHPPGGCSVGASARTLLGVGIEG